MAARRKTKKAAPVVEAKRKPLPDMAPGSRGPLVPRIAADSISFRPAVPPPGVVPKGAKLAMDEDWGSGFGSWAASSFSNLGWMEGYTFLGYPHLAQLAQIAEYRLMVETIAKEATRKWIQIQSTADEAEKKKNNGRLPDGYESKADKITELEKEMERLGVRGAFRTISEHDGFYGRAHLYIDTDDGDDRDELKLPLGDGGKVSERKLKKGSIKAFKPIEPVWCYPARYEASNPLKATWYNPQTWYVMGRELDKSRLLPFVHRPVPDIYKPAFSFGGLSLTQMAKPYVDNWLQTRQSVNDIIHAFSVMILSTEMSQTLQAGTAELDKRVKMFTNYRDNKGLMVLDKNTEDFKNVSAPLGTLDHLQAQAQEHMCSVSQIPLVKFTGISPSGLNASSEGEIQVFEDNEHAYQESFFGANLKTVFRLSQVNLWGKVDEDLDYVFSPLHEMTEKELADMRKVEADTDDVYVNNGTLDQQDVRQRLAGVPDGPYASLDPSKVPEIDGPLPENVRQTDKVDEPGGESSLEDAA